MLGFMQPLLDDLSLEARADIVVAFAFFCRSAINRLISSH